MIAKHIRVQRPRSRARPGSGGWEVVPNCERLEVWEVSRATASDDTEQRVIFHVDFAAGIARGNLVTYMGEQFLVREIADSQRLRGIELRCAPVAADSLATPLRA